MSLAEDLAEQSALLLAGAPAIRVTALRDAGVTYGVGLSPRMPFLERARASGIPTLRRSSGGSGVLHGPGDVAWVVVLPRNDPRVGPSFVHDYGRLGRGVVEALAKEAVRGVWSPPLGLDDACCLLSARGRVLTVDDRVLGGAAQHVTANAFLHHGILPRAIDRRLLAEVFHLSAPSARRLTSLEEIGVAWDTEPKLRDLGAAIARSLGASG